MTTIAFIAAGSSLVAFGLLCIATANVWHSYRANRKAEAASQTKRQHDAAVAAFASILREAILLGRKK